MARSSDKLIAVFMLVAMAFPILLVDHPWVRLVLALVPALFLAQRALAGAPLATAGGSTEERRSDNTLRERIQELLDLIRDFYRTCHMVAVGQLEPSKAKARAAAVEKRLSEMMADMLAKVEAGESAE